MAHIFCAGDQLSGRKRTYRDWQDSGNLISSKARLFRVLARQFLGYRDQKRQWKQPTPFHSENARSASGSGRGISQNTMTSIKPSHLPRLDSISQVVVKRAISRFRPHSRLMLILLYCERFSYADIACITDHSENTTKAILARLHRKLPQYILKTGSCLEEIFDTLPAVG